MKHKIEHHEYGPNHTKGILWDKIKEIYKPEVTINAIKNNKQLVFVQSALYHISYAYTAYLSILSLYASTDIYKYDIRIYCTKNLETILTELFKPFNKVTIITQQPILEIHPEWSNITPQNLVIKTQYWWDKHLLNYDVICGIDADLLAVGKGGSFDNLCNISDGIMITPISNIETDEYLSTMMGALNKNPKGNHIKRLREQFKIQVQSDTNNGCWGNTSLYAFNTKYIKEEKYKFSLILDFWFSEPCLCDESFLLLFSLINKIEMKDINEALINLKNYLEHSPQFEDKTLPMHLINYQHSAAITHRISTIESCRKLAPKFNEYINYVTNNYKSKHEIIYN